MGCFSCSVVFVRLVCLVGCGACCFAGFWFGWVILGNDCFWVGVEVVREFHVRYFM